ncbi:MAG: dihydroneopterin aldolase family protein [Candidatus Thermoplasmatota archaeon]|nr:dihydroneopterin aldolase family protein [Candidatus Thermoplasmatota archaeon]
MTEDKSKEDIAAAYFRCRKRERAAFETGIKLGSLFHQYVGAPLSLENLPSLEKAMEEGCRVQPFVVDAEVHIDRSGLDKKEGVYDYTTLEPERLEIRIVIDYGGERFMGRMRFIPELDYPLMWLEEISPL